MEKPKEYKVVIFDFDGTIADTFDLLVRIVNEDPAQFGIDGISEDEIPRLRNMSISYLIEEFKINVFRLPMYAALVRKKVRAHMKEAKPFKDIPFVLTQMKESNKYTLGIVTANSVQNVKVFLKSNDLEIFDFIYSAPSLFGKDNKLKQVLKKYGFRPEDVLYIGDEIRDIGAARKNDIDVLSVLWGFNSEKIIVEHKPDYVAETPQDILKTLGLNSL